MNPERCISETIALENSLTSVLPSFICIAISFDKIGRLLYEGIMRHSNSQQMVLAFVEQYQGENQRPPTIREIQDHCGFKSPRAVSYILEKLEEARLIIRRAHSRGIQLTKPRVTSTGVQLPLFSSIPAGLPDQFDGSEAPETLRFIPTKSNSRQSSKWDKSFPKFLHYFKIRAAPLPCGCGATA